MPEDEPIIEHPELRKAKTEIGDYRLIGESSRLISERSRQLEDVLSELAGKISQDPMTAGLATVLMSKGITGVRVDLDDSADRLGRLLDLTKEISAHF
jgi:hypothetical protein